jgi:hypothetical protein
MAGTICEEALMLSRKPAESFQPGIHCRFIFKEGLMENLRPLCNSYSASANKSLKALL